MTITRYCQYKFPNGDICDAAMECPDQSSRKYCDTHQKARAQEREKKRKDGHKSLEPHGAVGVRVIHCERRF